LDATGSVEFDSNFESGNLLYVIERDPAEYDLILSNDINSKGHTQWFFFAVRNRKRGAIKFNIVNMMKTGSLFQSGMQPVCFSEEAYARERLGWYRDGTDVRYFKNIIKRVYIYI
jgi:hypothetical protein